MIGLILNVPGRVAEAADGKASDSKGAPLTLKLSGYVAPAESDVIVRMRVEPDTRARELLVEWVSDDLSGGSHVIALDGERSAIAHQYQIKGLPEGVYVVSATLRFSDGTEARKQVNVIMVGASGWSPGEGMGERGARKR
jgi:hypothetical protein